MYKSQSAGVKEASGAAIVIPLWATMSSVPAESAVIDHATDEKSEIKLIDWGKNFAVYPLKLNLPPTKNLWIFVSWTYLPDDGSTPHPVKIIAGKGLDCKCWRRDAVQQ